MCVCVCACLLLFLVELRGSACDHASGVRCVCACASVLCVCVCVLAASLFCISLNIGAKEQIHISRSKEA